MKQFDADVFKLYNVMPSSDPSGLKAGVPFVELNSINPGIGVGIAMTSLILLPSIDTPLYTGTIPANSDYYLPLSELTLPIGVKKVTGITPDETYIDFGCAVGFAFDRSAAGGTFVVSMADIYDQQMTYTMEAPTASPFDQPAPRQGQKLFSIKVQNLTNASITFTLTILPAIELPYYDFGDAAYLLNKTTPNADNNIVTGMQLVSPNQDYFQIPNIETATSSNPFEPGLTATYGTVRTRVNVSERIQGDPNPWPVFVRQAVFGCGNPLPPELDIFVDGVDMRPTLKNNVISVIGGQQYNVGWTGWQG